MGRRQRAMVRTRSVKIEDFSPAIVSRYVTAHSTEEKAITGKLASEGALATSPSGIASRMRSCRTSVRLYLR